VTHEVLCKFNESNESVVKQGVCCAN